MKTLKTFILVCYCANSFWLDHSVEGRQYKKTYAITARKVEMILAGHVPAPTVRVRWTGRPV